MNWQKRITVIGDILGILFAFVTNDTIVFNPRKKDRDGQFDWSKFSYDPRLYLHMALNFAANLIFVIASHADYWSDRPAWY